MKTFGIPQVGLTGMSQGVIVVQSVKVSIRTVMNVQTMRRRMIKGSISLTQKCMASSVHMIGTHRVLLAEVLDTFPATINLSKFQSMSLEMLHSGGGNATVPRRRIHEE